MKSVCLCWRACCIVYESGASSIVTRIHSAIETIRAEGSGVHKRCKTACKSMIRKSQAHGQEMKTYIEIDTNGEAPERGPPHQ